MTRLIVGLSGGKDSTALSLRLRELEPDAPYEFLCTPVGNELAEMEAHWRKLEGLLGARIIRLKPHPGDGLEHLIRLQNALPNHRMRWCTRMLKIAPTIAFLKAAAPAVQFVGLRADEPAEERSGIYGDIPGVEQRYPLREWGWDEADVWNYLAERGVKIPRRTDCAWCFGQRIAEWYRLWRDYPDIYWGGAELEKLTGHTFRSPSRDSWPAGLVELAAEFEKRVPRGEQRKGCIQLDLYDDGEAEEKPCRVCTL